MGFSEPTSEDFRKWFPGLPISRTACPLPRWDTEEPLRRVPPRHHVPCHVLLITARRSPLSLQVARALFPKRRQCRGHVHERGDRTAASGESALGGHICLALTFSTAVSLQLRRLSLKSMRASPRSKKCAPAAPRRAGLVSGKQSRVPGGAASRAGAAQQVCQTWLHQITQHPVDKLCSDCESVKLMVFAQLEGQFDSSLAGSLRRSRHRNWRRSCCQSLRPA